MKFNIGDKVKVRSWESMEKEFGLDNIGDIGVNTTMDFVKVMKKFCGKELTIKKLNNNFNSYNVKENLWCWSDGMFEERKLLMDSVTPAYRKGTFMWAVQQMREGKKVRRKSIHDFNIFIQEDTPHIKERWPIVKEINKEVSVFVICSEDIEATDWELFYENSFEGKYFIFEVTTNGFINQRQKETSAWIAHRLDEKDIHAFKEAIKRAEEIEK